MTYALYDARGVSKIHFDLPILLLMESLRVFYIMAGHQVVLLVEFFGRYVTQNILNHQECLWPRMREGIGLCREITSILILAELEHQPTSI